MAKVVSPVVYDNFEPELFYDAEYNSPATVESVPRDETEIPVPQDKYNFVYCVFYLLGTSILLPWFFFVTCNDYWMYRFRDLKNNNTFELEILEDSEPGSNRTRLQADFTSYISIASTVPSTLFLFVNVFYLHRFSIHWRVLGSSVVILLCFIETTILVLIDSDSWQFRFFVVTLGTVVVLNMATAMLQAALCGIFMRFPVSYISAFSSGQSLAGIFASLALLCTLVIDMDPKNRTFLYFLFGDITILASFVGYLAITQSDFFLYYANGVRDDHGSIQYHRIESEVSVPAALIDYGKIQKKTWIPSAGLFFDYVVTASVYPSIAVLVCSENMGVKSAWDEKYFVPTVTYLLYCVCDYIGRISAGLIRQPKGLGVIWFSLLRFCFIPLFMLCNAQPRHHLPVLIDSDWLYACIISTLALSNGYLATLTFVLIPECSYPHEQEVASTMLVTWLAASLSVGSVLSFPLVNFL